MRPAKILLFVAALLPAAYLTYLAGIPRRLAHCRENPYQLLTDWVPETEPAEQIRHEVRRQLDLVAAVGGRTGSALQQWAPLDGSAGPSADEVVAALEALPDPTTGAGGGDGQVLVLRVDGGVHAIPVAVPGTPSGRPTP